jgi:transcriptional regulator with PAS, ATPase and Fis domain
MVWCEGAGQDDATMRDTARAAPGQGDTLVVVGNGDLETFELDGGDVVIGRGEDCDVTVEHRVLSRRHAILRVGPPASVQDLGSTNGTRIAGVVRRGGEPVALHGGETFHIGPIAFIVVRRSGSRAGLSSGRSGGGAATGDPLCVLDPSLDAATPVLCNLARSDASVLILGETGVGKEVLASTMHALSERTGAMTRVNCAALSDSLLESELFGYERGAFTGAAGQKIGLIEAADRGTVFLDEIGEMPLSSQAKLLRVVEQREVLRLGAVRPIPLDVRFVAATNRDLWAEVEASTFRRDLFFRLGGIELLIPPLRERRSQIGPLALRFLEQARARLGKPQLRLDHDALSALEAHSWPGNVRELKAVVERAALLVHRDQIGVKHLALSRRSVGRAAGPPGPPSTPAPTARPSVESTPVDLGDAHRADRDRVVRALEAHAGNQTRAAKHLGISRSTLTSKLIMYRIPRPRV